MNIQRNVDLSKYNTFQIKVQAKYLIKLDTADDLKEIILQKKFNPERILVLGLGANILFTKNFDGLVIKNNLKGIKLLKETSQDVVLRISSGENWHQLVEYTVNKGWSGIENMVLIPSTIGGAATQNIAAYGQNLQDVFVSLLALNLETGKIINFSNQECQFSYRDSIFKKAGYRKYFIISIDLKLSKQPIFDISYHSRYESLESELKGLPQPYTSKQIFEAVIRLRKSKLPDWTKIPTAGSFFRNPIVSKQNFLQLSKKITDLQSYPVEKLTYDSNKIGDLVKIPAGRLLDELGWKGKKIGQVGTFDKNALAIINLGGATGQEIFEFSQLMRGDCLKKYGVRLEPEVNII